jgi:hypothetical protein
MQLVHDYFLAEFCNKALGLAKLGKVFKLPTVLTTSLGQGPNGPFVSEVVSMFPDVPVIFSAWDDPKVVAANEKTGRKNLIMAGVTVDLCLAFAVQGSYHQLDCGCGRAAAVLGAADWVGLGRGFHDHCHSYGILIDSFESKTAKAAQTAS